MRIPLPIRASLAMLALLLVAGSCGSQSGSAPAGDLNTTLGYLEGYERARQNAQPMLVLFAANWCEHCQNLGAEALSDARVIELSQRFTCVLVDVDREPDVCRHFLVAGYPTVQFFSARGQPLNRLEGNQQPEAFLQAMRVALGEIGWRPSLWR